MSNAQEQPKKSASGREDPAYLRGYKLYQHGAFSDARDAVLEAISEDFANAHAWALLSTIYADMEEPEHAAEAARQAVRSDLHNPEWRVLRALQVQLEARFDEAKGEFAKAIELDPNYVSAWFNRALLEARLGEDDAAIADLQRAIQIKPAAWDMIDHYDEFDRLRDDPNFPPEPEGLDDLIDEDVKAQNPFMALKLPKDSE